MNNYQALMTRLAEVRNVNRAQALLDWDQQVNMPPGGAKARAAQKSTLSRIGHEMFTAPETGALIDGAAAEVATAAYDSDEASLIRVVEQDYADLTRLPTAFVAEYTAVKSEAYEVWTRARAAKDFAAFAPILARVYEYARREADYLGYADHPYDAMINRYERGMTTARVRQLFDAHRQPLVDLIARVKAAAHRVDDAILYQPFAQDGQRQFALDVIKAFGFDMQRGRQDVSVHPFAIRFSRGDTRITTRFSADTIKPALFGTMHEAGHALYEQGIPERLDGTMLGWGTSLGVHESQSRLWENLVGRSKGFWSWALPKLQAVFPRELGGVDLDTFYKAINKVEDSFIRVEADEATYNLHIMIRFEIELLLMSGDLRVEDLPAAWNERFEAYFGMTPPDDAMGVLQDIHWSNGLIGYFPTYAIGNLLSTQYYYKALQDHPQIPDEIAAGKFDTLLTWLNTNIHQHGRKFTADALTERVTGDICQCADFMTYLDAKYTDIYGL